MRARVVLVLALVAGLLAIPQTAEAKTVTVCVKKATGIAKISKSGKCRKGWVKRRFDTRGARGGTGGPGAPGNPGDPGVPDLGLAVIDGSGGVVGRLRGVYALVPILFIVEIDGGYYWYYGNGNVFPMANAYFLNPSCSGQAYIFAGSVQTRDQVMNQLGYRVVQRVNSVALPPVLAYRPTQTSTPINATPAYLYNATGTCVTAGSLTGFLVNAQPVPGIRDVPGPLTLR